MENTVRVAAEIFNELCDFLRRMRQYLSLLTWSTELFPKIIFELERGEILDFFLSEGLKKTSILFHFRFFFVGKVAGKHVWTLC